MGCPAGTVPPSTPSTRLLPPNVTIWTCTGVPTSTLTNSLTAFRTVTMFAAPIEVELRTASLPLVRPFRTSRGAETEKDVLLLRWSTPEATGWAECGADREPAKTPDPTVTPEETPEEVTPEPTPTPTPPEPTPTPTPVPTVEPTPVPTVTPDTGGTDGDGLEGDNSGSGSQDSGSDSVRGVGDQ